MEGEGRGLFGQLRTFMNVGLCVFLSIQYAIVVKLALEQAEQTHALKILWLPVVYLCPLAAALGFRAHIKRFVRESVLSARVASTCRDWITVLLLLMYAGLLDFRHLH